MKNTDINKNITLFIARVWISLFFLYSGFEKINDYSGVSLFMEQNGISGLLLPFVIILEVGGALSIIFGFLTRFTSVALFSFILVSDILFNRGGDYMSNLQLLLYSELAWAGGFLFLIAVGPGKISIDYLISIKKSKRITPSLKTARSNEFIVNRKL